MELALVPGRFEKTISCLSAWRQVEDRFYPQQGSGRVVEATMSRWMGSFVIVYLVFALCAVSPRARARAARAPGAQSSASASSSSETPTLDFEFFKERVEPIFLTKRPTHARCYVCHEGATHPFRLVKLSPGETSWNEEESQRNFKVVSQLVNPDDPMDSMILRHPLAPEAGGDAFHSGGRQFESQNDPDWQTLAEWVRGQKLK
jgi:hypothetical protein